MREHDNASRIVRNNEIAFECDVACIDYYSSIGRLHIASIMNSCCELRSTTAPQRKESPGAIRSVRYRSEWELRTDADKRRKDYAGTRDYRASTRRRA